jgi:hypothetical protein
MRRSHRLISAAWLLQGIAWFLPAFGSNPGWVAFYSACFAFAPNGSGVFDTWYKQVLSAASVLTTVFFIFGSPWAILRRSRSVRRASAWIAFTALLVNAHWFVYPKPDRLKFDLGIGYFFWWGSFLLLALGLFDLAGPRLHESGSSAS